VIDFASRLPDFLDLVRATAEWKSVPAGIVEKDYYLTRALRALQELCGGQFLLKGGTSLAKGWNLLDRFSEDIDLLFRTHREDGGPLGKNAIDRRFKTAEKMLAAVEEFTRETHPFNSETGVHRTVTFSYPRRVEAISGLGATVVLEMGVRGGFQPSATRRIESLVASFAQVQGVAGEAADLASFEMELADVRRTFVEKLFAAHAVFEANRAARQARHYYDLFCLCGLKEIQEFAGSPEYVTLRAEIRALSQEHFPAAPLPPEEGFRRCAAFAPSPQDLRTLEKNYAQEHGLFLRLPPPAMPDILARIGSLLPKL
jgi:hypothetical protein